MNNEFKAKNYKDATVYVLESASSGGTSAGSVASTTSPMGGVRKRGDNLIAQEGNKDKVPPTTPRNFVAKNAKTGGAGAHKDKKKANKQGDHKHKNKDLEIAEVSMPFGSVNAPTLPSPTGGGGRDPRWRMSPAGKQWLAMAKRELISAFEEGRYEFEQMGEALTHDQIEKFGQQKMQDGVTADIYVIKRNITNAQYDTDPDEPEQDTDWASDYASASDEDRAEFQQHVADQTGMSLEDAGKYIQYAIQHGDINPEEWKGMQAKEFAEAGGKVPSGMSWDGNKLKKRPELVAASKADKNYQAYLKRKADKEKASQEKDVAEAFGGPKGYDSDGNPQGGGYDEYPPGWKDPQADRPQIVAWWFFNVPPGTPEDEISYLGIKLTKSGKYGMPQYDKSGRSFALRMNTATQKFGPGKKWVPKNESISSGAAKTDDAYLAYLAQRKADKAKQLQQPQQGVAEDHSDVGRGWGQGSEATAYRSSALAGAGHDDRIRENPDWYNDEANSMTSAQLKSLVKHASKLRQAVKSMGTDTLEPWQQAKVTKAADYLDAVFNAVDDEHDMGEGNHPDEKEDKALIRKMVKQQALKQEDGYMAELFNKLAEKIPANAPVDRWIKDFDKASKTPNAKGHHQFKNKNKEKVRQMAIAASYGAKNPKKKK